MSQEDTSHPREDDHATPRVDDRNDEIEESPAPDPEVRDSGAADDPGAD